MALGLGEMGRGPGMLESLSRGMVALPGPLTGLTLYGIRDGEGGIECGTAIGGGEVGSA